MHRVQRWEVVGQWIAGGFGCAWVKRARMGQFPHGVCGTRSVMGLEELAGSNGHFRGDTSTGAKARQVGLLQVRVPWHICSPMGFQLGAKNHQVPRGWMWASCSPDLSSVSMYPSPRGR